MATRANRDPRYYLRFQLIGLALVGFALWSLYDGAVAYPAQRERALAFKKLLDENRGDDWKALAAKNGWPADFPGEPKESADIAMQYTMAAVAGTIAFFMLLGVWRSRGRWIEGTENGVSSSWGQSFNFDQVLSVDKKKWRGKGIAKVKYADGGRKRTFVIDDYKFDRHPTDQILYELESNISPEKIVGGPPEPPPETADAQAEHEPESSSVSS